MNNQVEFDKDRIENYSNIISTLMKLTTKLDIVSPADEMSCLGLDPIVIAKEWETLSDNSEINKYAREETLIRTPLILGADEEKYWLILILPIIKINSVKQTIQLSKVLEQTAKLIQDDHNHSVTLNGMAVELAIRYEELNTIYGIENLAQYNNDKNINEEDALSMLAKSCLDYLAVDLIAVCIPSDKILIKYIDDDLALEQNDTVIDTYLYQTANKVKETAETWVINHNEVTDWTAGIASIPYKLVISPIFSMNHIVNGILVFANKLDKLDFTNSDRKLCDVLATEAANILRNKRDLLTGLYNRNGFEQHIIKAITGIKQNNEEYSLVMIDIDQFKMINEAAGNDAGDKLLQQISSLLKTKLEKSVIISRTGPDEFCVLLHSTSLKKAEEVAKSINAIVSSIQYVHKEHIFDISLSTGVMSISIEIEDPSLVLSQLEIVCQSAKLSGGNRIQTYLSNDQAFIAQRRLIRSANMVKEAVRKQQFILFGQEIYHSNNNEPKSHYEILIRMVDDDNKIIPPGMFIPAAEQYKMMLQLDQWVLEKTLEALSFWLPNNSENNLILSVNISGQSISDDRFSTTVSNIINASGVPPKHLCFEITETAAVANLAQALGFIGHMRELGCSFALDDFGSGMSSFNYLKNLPVDYLKIDGCFVRNMLEESIDHAMVESINNIGHVMGLKTIAEYVENKALQKELTRIQVDYLQGYGIHKPEPLRDILKLDFDMPVAKQQHG